MSVAPQPLSPPCVWNPIDHPRPRRCSVTTVPAPRWTCRRSSVRNCKPYAQSLGATLFELLLAAYVVLLYRFTGQDDLLIGVPNSGRSRPEIGPIVGYFVNPFVLRATLGEGMTFRQLLAEVRERARQGCAHAEYPFPLLVQRLQPERGPTARRCST